MVREFFRKIYLNAAGLQEIYDDRETRIRFLRTFDLIVEDDAFKKVSFLDTEKAPSLNLRRVLFDPSRPDPLCIELRFLKRKGAPYK